MTHRLRVKLGSDDIVIKKNMDAMHKYLGSSIKLTTQNVLSNHAALQDQVSKTALLDIDERTPLKMPTFLRS
jgi:hypothetical protein